jgi:hypothetical protein
LTLTIRTSTDCHLTVVSIDQRGRATVLYPSDFEANNLLGAGRPLRLPAEGAPYVLRLRERGREVIAAQCNPGGATVDGIRHEFERQRFTDLGDYGTFLAQAFDSERQQVRRTAAPPATEQRGRGRRQARERAEGTDTQARPEAIARTAITIEVR